MKKRENINAGGPTIIVEYEPATEEQVLKNRKDLEETLSQIFTSMYGFPIKYEIEWGEKPENYGRKNIMKDGIITYLD